MSNNVKFHLDQTGVQEAIYTGNERLRSLERDVAERALSEVRAAFLNQFGRPGNFTLEFKWIKVASPYAKGGVRPIYKIRAADAATVAALKGKEGWLDQFAQNAKL